MDTDKEKDAVENVAERLTEKFPTVDRSHVDEVVQAEYEALADAKVRDYIPVLVENQARNDLIDETRAEAPAEAPDPA